MRIYDGYVTIGKGKKKRKIAFEVAVGTKKRAWEEMKKKYPQGRVFVIGFHLKK